MLRQAAIRQRAFVKHLYNVNNPQTFGNGTRSAEKAGYQGDENTLAVTAHRLLRNNKVLELVENHVSKVLTSAEVLEKLSSIASAKIEDPKASDVIKTLELLAKHHKLLTDKVETSDTTEKDSAAILMESINSQPNLEKVSYDHCKNLIKQASERKLKAVS